jgi:hypothetical protein
MPNLGLRFAPTQAGMGRAVGAPEAIPSLGVPDAIQRAHLQPGRDLGASLGLEDSLLRHASHRRFPMFI